MKFTYQVILSVLAFGSALNAAPVETSLEERAPVGAGFNDRTSTPLGLGTTGAAPGAGFNDRASTPLGLGTTGAAPGAGFNDRASPELGFGDSGPARPKGQTSPKSPADKIVFPGSNGKAGAGAGAGKGAGNRGSSDKLVFSN